MATWCRPSTFIVPPSLCEPSLQGTLQPVGDTGIRHGASQVVDDLSSPLLVLRRSHGARESSVGAPGCCGDSIGGIRNGGSVGLNRAVPIAERDPRVPDGEPGERRVLVPAGAG